MNTILFKLRIHDKMLVKYQLICNDRMNHLIYYKVIHLYFKHYTNKFLQIEYIKIIDWANISFNVVKYVVKLFFYFVFALFYCHFAM